MSELTRHQRAYHAAIARADAARAVFVAEVRAQRAAGRTLDDIGRELGLSRSRVLRIVRGGGDR